MTFEEYQALASRTMNPELTEYERFISCTLGLVGEAGEFADLVKKQEFHDHPVDDTKLIKELGDILWYVANMCSELGCNLEYVASQNILKLKRRYPEGFSSRRSIEKNEEQE